MLGRKVGIDPGALTTRVTVRGEPAVGSEASCVAVETGPEGPRALAVGTAARRLAAERPELSLVWPVGPAGIAVPAAYEALLVAALARGCGRQRIFKPDVMVAVPSAMGGGDRRTVLDICARAGARAAYLIERPLAAAIGAAVPVALPSARIVMDIGASVIDAAVLAREGSVVRLHHPHGAADLTAAIGRAVAARRGVELSMLEAEELKRGLGSAGDPPEAGTVRVPAHRDGVPVEIEVSGAEVAEAAGPWLAELAGLVRRLVEETPAGLREDVTVRNPLLLSGGGALLRGLDRYLSSAAGLPVTIARDPADAVARGTAGALDSLDVVRRTFLYVR